MPDAPVSRKACPSAVGAARYLGFYAGWTVLMLAAMMYNKGLFGGLPAQGTPLRYACALLPAAPMAAVIWLQVFPAVAVRDEFQRLIQLRAAAGALGATVVVLGGWAFLSQFAGVGPAQPATILALVIILGAPAQIFAMWKYR